MSVYECLPAFTRKTLIFGNRLGIESETNDSDFAYSVKIQIRLVYNVTNGVLVLRQIILKAVCI
jgi:hypothetical protein